MILKQGSRGSDVANLQTKLNIMADGIYGPQTKETVVKFQQAHKLNADGIVGGLTWRALFGIDMPAPKIAMPIYQRDLMEIFGDPHESSFATTWLRNTTVDLGSKKIKIYCNDIMITPLQLAVSLLKQRGLASQWHTYDGCWNVRYMRGGNSLSVHSWGLAIDINAAENPFGSDDFQMTEEFAACFEDAGFTWGGRWRMPSTDAMHFQLCRVK
jgi:hypothetical protein